MAVTLTRDQMMDCLSRQVSDLFSGHTCGEKCPIFGDCPGACPIVGEAAQYECYQQLLQDPSVPADQAAPLIDRLELWKDPEYDAPDLNDLMHAVYDLVNH